jgi:membrane protease YdiL (CAAX protease family)
MIRTRDIQIDGHSIGTACTRLGLAFGAGFLALALLSRIPEFNLLTQNSPWIPKYIADSLAFGIGMIMIWRLSQSRLKEYGFTLAKRKLRLSAALGIILASVGILLDHLPELIAGKEIVPTYLYPLTVTNILGMMSFQWIFVGIFEETITRGLVQIPLMNRLNGTATIFKWDFHIGSVITGIIFGVGHFVPHIFFGGSWFLLAPHLIFATIYGLSSSYIYQETRSLVGPILMHNIVDGLSYSVDFFFY